MEINKIFLDKSLINKEVELKGWIRYKRVSKKIGFLTFFDGSNLEGIQIVFKRETNEKNFKTIEDLGLFSGLVLKGTLLLNSKNNLEVELTKIVSIFETKEEQILGKKEHGLEFLREVAHIRPKTKLFQSIMKVRSKLLFYVHNYFNENNFINVSSPIITSNDAEGAGETFYLKDKRGQNFFSNNVSLSVSGQLHAESYAQAFSKVYTFGPTFRAEKSNTKKHAAEFWMIEPEAAFYDYNMMMDLGEDLIKYLSKKIINDCKEELLFLESYWEKDIIKKLNDSINNKFKKMSYSDAIKHLQKALKNGVNFVESDIKFGIDLSSEHEKYLSKEIGKGPIYIYDYPKEIKSFYMYGNKDGKTVRGFDLLVPEIGELIGGSERETSYEKLLKIVEEKNIKYQDFKWYIDMRKNGYVQSSGFGIGFERLVMYFTGTENIRDVLPFPVTVGKINF